MDGDPGHVLDRLEEKLADVLFVLPDRPAKDQLIGGHQSLPQSQSIIKASPRAKCGQVLNTGPGRFRR